MLHISLLLLLSSILLATYLFSLFRAVQPHATVRQLEVIPFHTDAKLSLKSCHRIQSMFPFVIDRQ